jgi:hypothetical protein
MKEDELVDGAEKPFVPKRGDRVRVVAVDENDPSPARLVGDEVTVDAAHDRGGGWIRLDAAQPPRGNSSGCWCRVELVAPAIAEKAGLHENGCILCGGPTQFQRSDGRHLGARYCGACRGPGPAHVDAEITRRKQLAANTQPVAAQPANAETPKADPYVKHREALGLSPAAIAQATVNRDRGDTDKQRQAFRELDRGIKGPKYVYAESSGCFSTATWESD